MTVHITVNGEARAIDVPPRTQLAEILRDHLDLTATHLACEQGVCGACTVMVNDRPTRSCITFAGACNGAKVETLEGFAGDRIMEMLREAFSRHHALQCGFCTPGMLATARDIVSRLGTADEKRIRNELSGNLCRCTGYVGIVKAIREVIERRTGEGSKAQAAADSMQASPRGFAPFEAQRTLPEAVGRPTAAGRVAIEGGWTIVERDVEFAYPVQAAWAHFRDLRAVATCLPGAVLDEVGDRTFSGRIEVKFGLIGARFEGAGTYGLDEPQRFGTLTGAGRDKTGQSNVTGNLSYRIGEGAQPDTSLVTVTVRFRIEGMLAQFNRPELVTGFVDYLLGQFVANCDRVLSGGTVEAGGGLNVFAMMWAVLRNRIGRLLSRG